MAEMHVLFTGSLTLAVRQLTCSQSFLDQFRQRGLNVLVIHGKQTGVCELHVWLRMRSKEQRCSVVDHVMWQRICNGGDHDDGRTGEATEAGEVPRGFWEQWPGAEGDVQRWGALRLPGFRLHQQFWCWTGQHPLYEWRRTRTPVRIPGLWAGWQWEWAWWSAHVCRSNQGLDVHHQEGQHTQ